MPSPPSPLRLAFLIYAYFPYGGQQRDFAAIAGECLQRGHSVDAYHLRWRGEVPPGLRPVPVPLRGLSRVAQYRRYTRWVSAELARQRYDLVLGFSPMPGLDLLFAADPCFAEKAETQRGRYYRFTPRYRHFIAYERAVFSGGAGTTKVMVLSPQQRAAFIKHYPGCEDRLVMMPPWINPDRLVTPAHRQGRAALRAEYGIGPDDLLLLQIGSSGFRIKGVDRALQAIAALPESLRRRCRYLLIGQDRAAPFLRLARRLGVAGQFRVLPARDDIPRFLAAADLLLHPAYRESSGYTLLEALIAGLPVLTTATCGYASHVTTSGGGLVCPEPFNQQELAHNLRHMLQTLPTSNWSANGKNYAQREDLYTLPTTATTLIEQTALNTTESAGGKSLKGL